MSSRNHPLRTAAGVLLAVASAAQVSPARADAITDWNQRTARIVADARIGTPPAIRVMAIVQTAAYEAARDVARQPSAQPQAVAVAIAAAHRATLAQLLPGQRAAVEAAYQSALGGMADDAARARHAGTGEQAARRVLAARAGDLPAGADNYRPLASPGSYVPTVWPAVTQWPARTPWLLQRADQFRPGPPPALASARWATDYNELKALGGRDSTQRNAEQTAIGRFWDYSMPAIYHGVVRSVALQPGRDLLANARLFAVVSQAMDDALIAVFDAKYHYNLWRPVTAIRNGDIDGNEGTERDANWLPLIDTPMHPEYPCAHCVLAGSVAAVLAAETGPGPLPTLATTSPTAGGAERRWSSLASFVDEVAQARIYGGVHFRHSTEVGVRMGRHIGERAVQLHAESQP